MFDAAYVNAGLEGSLDRCTPSFLEFFDILQCHGTRSACVIAEGLVRHTQDISRPSAHLHDLRSAVQRCPLSDTLDSPFQSPRPSDSPKERRCYPCVLHERVVLQSSRPGNGANSTIFAKASTCESFQRPKSSGVIRPVGIVSVNHRENLWRRKEMNEPSGVMAVASVRTRPGPRWMMPPRCA